MGAGERIGTNPVPPIGSWGLARRSGYGILMHVVASVNDGAREFIL